MKVYSFLAGGLLSTFSLVFLSTTHAQTGLPDPIKADALKDKDVPVILPERSAEAAPVDTVPTPTPEKITTPPKKMTPAPTTPEVVSVPPSAACSTCAPVETCSTCISHPLLYKLFHPFQTVFHKPLFHRSCCGFHLFHRHHGCSSCGDSYSGTVIGATPGNVGYGSYAMAPMYAPYAYSYAYYPYAYSTMPAYPVQAPAIVAVRAPYQTPINSETLESWKNLPANTLYSKAIGSYWDKDYRAAQEMFWILVANEPNDSRFWYFKALTERALGDLTAAQMSAQRGAAVEYLNPDQGKLVNNVLERVQGQDRQFLRDPGVEITSLNKARMIVAQPLPKRTGAIDDQVVQTKK